MVTGRTGQNKLVHFGAGAGRPPREGSYATVEVVDAARHHLSGVLLEVTAPPSHRTRIPVAGG